MQVTASTASVNLNMIAKETIHFFILTTLSPESTE